MSIQEIAAILDAAANNANAVPQISTNQSFSESTAYEIQKLSIDQRLKRGEKLIGLKMGFTSKAKMEQMGVHDLIWGRLTDAMYYEDGSELPFDKFIHPRAEPEICFKIKKDLTEAVSMTEIKDYVDGVAGAIEIIDSRYQNFKFSLEDVIADNCSSAGLVIGKWHNPNIDISDLKIDLVIDNEVVQTGSSAAILGNPWESLVDAARLANQYGEPIKAGMVVMAGAATSAVYLKKGQEVKAIVEELGEVALLVK